MHEQSLMTDLVAKAEAAVVRSGAGRAVRVTVRLGALSHLSPAHLVDHFAAAAAGGPLAGAELAVIEGTDPEDPSALDVVLTSVDVVGTVA